MGWFWQTPPHSPKVAPNNSSQQKDAQSSTKPPTQQPKGSNDDAEIAKFLQLFQEADAKPSSSTSQPSSTGQQPQQSSPPSSSQHHQRQAAPSSFLSQFSRPFREDPSGASPTRRDLDSLSPSERAKEEIVQSLMPTDMSCRDAFDYAYGCNSVRGQFNAVYRYGEVRSCSELWDNFWFCMRVKNWQGDMRANAIRDRWRDKEERKYGPGMPSSEDVWRPRLKLLGPDEAFRDKIPEMDAELTQTEDDLEWNRQETERRRVVREKMGFKGDGY
ncbi:hypothetical protein PspLS_05736 [Pyricularia sp. CBS 133598]|nr:hypothetical protein PspLS_05736 [Pyricularia sp. CBS 133598]